MVENKQKNPTKKKQKCQFNLWLLQKNDKCLPEKWIHLESQTVQISSTKINGQKIVSSNNELTCAPNAFFELERNKRVAYLCVPINF